MPSLRSLKRPHWRRATVAAVTLMLSFAAVVAASNFGANKASGGTPAHICDATSASQCRANNASHSVYINVSGSYRTQILWAMSNYNSVAPPMNMFEVSPPGLDKDVEVLLIQSGIQALRVTS
jgi:hypothetical protein